MLSYDILEFMLVEWNALTEYSVLDCIEPILQQPLTNICLKRNSYINRVFEIELKSSKERLIVKFYRPQRWSKQTIEEEHALLQFLESQEFPVIAPLIFNQQSLFCYNSIYLAFFPKKWGRSLSELCQDDWQQLGRLLGRLHHYSSTYSTLNRPLWQPHHATQSHLHTLLNSTHIPEHYKTPLLTATQHFISSAQPLFAPYSTFLLHGDCHFGNIINRPDDAVYMIDFDDMVIGPAIQDIWMLLPDDITYCQQELDWFLAGYTLFQDFSMASLSLIEPLSIMRQIHFAAWCCIQASEPHFQHHFPHWGTTTYWNELIKDIQSIKM